MRFERYDSYRDSGVEWVENIPSSWNIDRVKNIATVRGRVGWKALKASEYVDKSDYIFLATPNIKYEEIDFRNVNYLTKERYYESPEIMLRVGDILLTKDGSTLGTVNIVKHLPKNTTVNSSIAVVRFKQDNSRFIMYQIKSDYIQNVIRIKKDGAGVPHLFQKDINNFKFLLPNIKIQNQIANYLDLKTKKIDKEISILEQKIEKYKELKETLIAETVLRGLDKDVVLKESGIEWVGSIPDHWDVKRVKDLYSISKRLVGENSHNFRLLSLTQNGVIYRDIDSGIGKFPAEFNTYQIVEQNDLIFCLFDMDVTPRTIGISKYYGMITGAYTIIKSSKNMFNMYYFYLFLMADMKKKLSRYYTGLRSTIKKEKFMALNLPVPSYEEQVQIVNYLDEKTSKIDSIVKSIEDKIKVLKEFRKTLINDVVTGKVKVA